MNFPDFQNSWIIAPAKQITRDFKRVWQGGVVHLTTANWLSRGTALGQRIFLARILGPEIIGHIGVVNAALSIIKLPAGVGTFTVISKIIAENIGNREKQKEAFGTAIWVNCCTTILVGICAWIILQHTKWLGDPVAQNLLKLLLLLLPIMIFNQVFQSALIGERRIKSVAAVQILIALLSIGAVVPMAWIWGLSGWLYNQYLVIVFSFFILVFLLRRIISFRWNGSTAKKVARIGGFAFAAQLLGTLIYQVDTLTVSGILKDPFSTGIYNTAALIAQQMIVFPGAILQATFPFVAHNRNDLKKLKARYQELLIKLALLGAIMAGVAWLICPFLFVLFGDKFYASISPFRVLIIGSVFQGLVILNNTYLDALGRTDIHFYTGIFSAVTAVSLNLAFIPHWQLMGAAWATTVTLFFSFLLRHVSVQYFIFHKKAIR